MSIYRAMLTRCMLLGAALLLVAFAAGCGGGGGSSSGGGDTTGPTISNPSASSPTDFRGGNVTVSATVSDPGGISSVTAGITKPDGTKTTVSMTGSSGIYTGTYSAPTNGTSAAQTYSVVIVAVDAAGNASPSGTIAFSVPSPDAPPPPPI